MEIDLFFDAFRRGQNVRVASHILNGQVIQRVHILCLCLPIRGAVFEDVPLVSLEHPHSILKFFLLLDHLDGATIELDHDLSSIDDSTLLIALEVALALTSAEGLVVEGLLKELLRRVMLSGGVK